MNEITRNALKPKTQLQARALVALGQAEFSNTMERDSFRDVEARTRASIYIEAWVEFQIEQIASINRKMKQAGMEQLINRVNNAAQMSLWIDQNKEEITEKALAKAKAAI